MADEILKKNDESFRVLLNKVEHIESLLINPQTTEIQKPGPKFQSEDNRDELSTVDILRLIIENRRLREDTFGKFLFADPAWDILLDLYVSFLERKSVTVTNACVAASVPATTALRYLKKLEEAGMLITTRSPLDRRVVLVKLTKNSLEKLAFLTNRLHNVALF